MGPPRRVLPTVTVSGHTEDVDPAFTAVNPIQLLTDANYSSLISDSITQHKGNIQTFEILNHPLVTAKNFQIPIKVPSDLSFSFILPKHFGFEIRTLCFRVLDFFLVFWYFLDFAYFRPIEFVFIHFFFFFWRELR